MKRFFLLSLLLFLFSTFSFAHHIIRGIVLSADNSEPLIGASVMIAGTYRGVVTNEAGYFEIGVDGEEVKLEISFIGYESKILTVHEHDGKVTVVLNSSSVDLNQVFVSAGEINALKSISKIDINIKPIKSSQEVLQIVPGLFIAQHAGGGKAEQIFLRGFDADHGTDVAIAADGLPGNMVSHAHGQGYADMHFIIPELINIADFGKGPYFTDKGNFNTGGYVDLKTYNTLNRSLVKMEAGDFNSMRALAAVNLLGNGATRQGHNAYMATEYNSTDGPFEAPQNFNRVNLFAKYAGYYSDKNFLTLTASRLNSKWDASGQIPDRAVQSGQLSRFGAIDSTEGGNTSRTNFSIKLLSNLAEGLTSENQVYFSRYVFELYSNFTFYLNDSVNGDQIRQQEFRDIYGLNGFLRKESYWNDTKLTGTLGYGFRYDDINNVELTHSLNRLDNLEERSLGDVDETNAWIYADGKMEIGKWLINLGLRYDGFTHDYYNKLDTIYHTQSVSMQMLSPKFNVIYFASPATSLYLKTGKGFHSNDTRVVVESNGNSVLPAAYGADLGTNTKIGNKLFLNLAAWYLFLEQEFVYVGDEAVVEPGGRTTRMGLDFSIRWNINQWLFADLDLTWAEGRSIDDEPGSNYIPLAPRFTSVGGLSFKSKPGFNGSLRYRYIADRPANEDNSIVALGYTVVDLRVNYTRPKYELFVSVENLFNVEWNEAQFATLSRLQNEPVPVEELHYTPGIPVFVKGGLTVFF
jgi:outer membrane cobalamin receptor